MFFSGLAALLLLLPLYKAGNRPLPLLLGELLALIVLLALLVEPGGFLPRTLRRLPWALSAAVALLLVYPLLQLVPLPTSIWASIPGHTEYASVLSRFGLKDAEAWRALSVIPLRTEYALLALLPPLACFLATMRLSTDQVARLLLIMTVFAGLEAFLGLLQVGTGGESIFYLRNDQAYGTATGTFVNRNHLAAMLAMMLPVMIGLMVFSLQPGRHRRNVARPSESAAKRVLLFGSMVVILLCLVFTRSRAGIGTALVGLAASAIVMVRARASNEGATTTRVATYLVGGLLVITFCLAAIIGLSPILDRMEPEQLRLSSDDRMAMAEGTLRAAFEFMPFGSGIGTYGEVFPRFQTNTQLAGWSAYAHNDYVQALMELGIAGGAAIVLLLIAYISRMARLLRGEGGRSFTLLQLAAGVGMLPLILHSAVDFSIHMPAVAVWYAMLAGVLFHKGVTVDEPFVGKKPKEAHQRRRTTATAAPAPAPFGAAPIP